MKLGIAYSTRDQVELTRQTFPFALRTGADIFWCDGSRSEEGIGFFEEMGDNVAEVKYQYVFGGADAAIAWKLSIVLASPVSYTHIGLLENDVLLDPDWLEPTLALFGKRKAEN